MSAFPPVDALRNRNPLPAVSIPLPPRWTGETTVTLKQGDCLELLKTLPDHSIQLAICDLPFGCTNMEWDKNLNLTKFWTEIKRVMVPERGVVACHAIQPFASQLIASNPAWFKFEIIWVKSNKTAHNLSKCQPLRQHEQILIFSGGIGGNTHGSKRQPLCYNPQGLQELIKPVVSEAGSSVRLWRQARSTKGSVQRYTNYPSSVIHFDREVNVVHPTQKPVALTEYLIRTFSDAGDTVLDPTMGSGTTGEAAILTDRSFIGFELDPAWLEVCEKRLSDDASGWQEYAIECGASLYTSRKGRKRKAG